MNDTFVPGDMVKCWNRTPGVERSDPGLVIHVVDGDDETIVTVLWSNVRLLKDPSWFLIPVW